MVVIEIKESRVWYLDDCYQLGDLGSAQKHADSTDALETLEHAGYSGLQNFRTLNERFAIVRPNGAKALCCIRTA